MYHYTIYNTDLGANSIQNPIKTSGNDCFCLSGLPFRFRDDGGAICASKHKSTPHFFNRVLNGISSRSGNNITHTHAYIHTHARTPSTSSSSTAEKRRRALIQQGREVSQPPWKPERRSWRRGGSKALEDSSQTHGKLQGQNIYTYIYLKNKE